MRIPRRVRRSSFTDRSMAGWSPGPPRNARRAAGGLRFHDLYTHQRELDPASVGCSPSFDDDAESDGDEDGGPR